MAKPFTDTEINSELEHLNGWEAMGWKSTEEIHKIFKFGSFAEAWGFVCRFVTFIEGMESHMNLEIYRPGSNGSVPVRISLGYKGRVTQHDFALAQHIESELISFTVKHNAIDGNS